MPQCTAFSDSAPSGRQIDGVLRGSGRSTASGSLRLVPVRQFRLEFRYVVIKSIKGRTQRNGLALGNLSVAARHRFNPWRAGKVDRLAHTRTVRRFIAPLHTTSGYPHLQYSSCDNVLIFRSVLREHGEGQQWVNFGPTVIGEKGSQSLVLQGPIDHHCLDDHRIGHWWGRDQQSGLGKASSFSSVPFRLKLPKDCSTSSATPFW